MNPVSILDWFARVKAADTTGTNFPATTAYVLGDVIDLKKTGIDQSMGRGENVFIVIRTNGLAFAGTSTNLSIDVVSSDTAPTTTWSTPTVHITGTVYATIAATPALGADWLVMQLPRGAYKRYLGLRANFATAAPTGGRVNAFLTMSVPLQQIVPQGIIGA